MAKQHLEDGVTSEPIEDCGSDDDSALSQTCLMLFRLTWMSSRYLLCIDIGTLNVSAIQQYLDVIQLLGTIEAMHYMLEPI